VAQYSRKSGLQRLLLNRDEFCDTASGQVHKFCHLAIVKRCLLSRGLQLDEAPATGS